LLPYFIGDGISGAIRFSIFETFKQVFQRYLSVNFQFLANFISAGFGMLVAAITFVPTEILKTRLQTSSV
jgi:hypothetical protein